MKNTTKIGVVLVVGILFFTAEMAVGLKTKSLALITDAFHYLNDIIAYVIAFVAAYLQERGEHPDHFTYGYHRAELVGAFFNGIFLLALAVSILLQSIERFVHIECVNEPMLVLITGGIGLALNIISVIVVHDHGHGHEAGIASKSVVSISSKDSESSFEEKVDTHTTHHHRVKPPVINPGHNLGLLGILMHVLGDAANNIAVMIAAVIMMKTTSPNRFYADPAASLFISFIIGGSAIPTTVKSGRILLESCPLHLDLSKIKEDLLSTSDVISVHDLHIWHLSQSVLLASVQVCVPIGISFEQWNKIKHSLKHCFEEYGIHHVTISPEIQLNLPTASEETIVPVGGCKENGQLNCVVMQKKQDAKIMTSVV